MRVIIAADDAQIAPRFRIDRTRTRSPDEVPAVVTAERSMLAPPSVEDDEEEEAEVVETETETEVETEDEDEDIEDDAQVSQSSDAADAGADEGERRPKRRRRRRRGGRREETQPGVAEEAVAGEPAEETEVAARRPWPRPRPPACRKMLRPVTW